MAFPENLDYNSVDGIIINIFQRKNLCVLT